jgi:hypothetical protein
MVAPIGLDVRLVELPEVDEDRPRLFRHAFPG